MSSEIALEIETIRAQVEAAVAEGATLESLNDCRVAVFGKKGAMTGLQRMLGKLSAAERPEAGKIINAAKTELTAKLDAAIEKCERAAQTAAEMRVLIDVTQPASGRPLGGFHPVVQVMMDVLEVLEGLGFVTVQGPEVETDFYNFEALNIPPIILRATCRTRSTSATGDCCALTRRACRSIRCSKWARRCASPALAASTAATTTPRTRRCSTRWRG